ncbi:hypothetical protein [Corallococcus exiguus]|uniref:hypothetical protein n=1 Tax=Corallococcus exiguus TaxID=83462 RepID=UPI0014712DA6|nr:hypothetical protein [Corallococcus exiguus]NNB86754.1 hypothetical protein [Corallococcus exiguus]
MSFLNVPLLDASVTGVRMDPVRELLQLELALHTCEKVRVDFSSACQWSLSLFERQNVLLDIHEWKASNVATAERCRDLGLDEFWTRMVLTDRYTLYEVAPSVGFGGWVLARGAEVIRAAPETAFAPAPDVFDFMEGFRKRPGMFVGFDDSQRVEQLRGLELLLHGYSSALRAHGVPEAGFGFVMDFANYLQETRGWSACCGPVAMIVKAAGRKHDVWVLFWKLVDEFRESLTRPNPLPE